MFKDYDWHCICTECGEKVKESNTRVCTGGCDKKMCMTCVQRAPVPYVPVCSVCTVTRKSWEEAAKKRKSKSEGR